MVHKNTGMESVEISGTGENAILLMSHDRILRSIRRIAYQIAEDNRGNSPILVIGIKKRGFAVAKLLVSHLESLTEKEMKLVQLAEPEKKDTSFIPVEGNTLADFNYIVLVDDVIFSGRTMLAAIQKIFPHVADSIIRTVVLVDRGHRSLPLRAEFVGLELPTKLNEHVRVVADSDTVKKVVLENSSD